MRAHKLMIAREDIERLSPLVYEHLNVSGHYSFTLEERILRGEFLALCEPEDLEELEILKDREELGWALALGREG